MVRSENIVLVVVVAFVLLFLGFVWGAYATRRPFWGHGFEYGIRMYHHADPDVDVNYLRWQKENGNE